MKRENWNVKKLWLHTTAVWQYGGFWLNQKLVLYLQSIVFNRKYRFIYPPHRQAAKRYVKE